MPAVQWDRNQCRLLVVPLGRDGRAGVHGLGLGATVGLVGLLAWAGRPSARIRGGGKAQCSWALFCKSRAAPSNKDGPNPIQFVQEEMEQEGGRAQWYGSDTGSGQGAGTRGMSLYGGGYKGSSLDGGGHGGYGSLTMGRTPTDW